MFFSLVIDHTLPVDKLLVADITGKALVFVHGSLVPSQMSARVEPFIALIARHLVRDFGVLLDPVLAQRGQEAGDETAHVARVLLTVVLPLEGDAVGTQV